MTTPAQTAAGREIDLKKLATELSAAGYVAGPVECSDEGEYTIAIRDRGAVDPIMTVNHVGFVWPEKVGNLAYYWDLLDIVRRHVSPAPAQDQLRARIRHAVDLHMVSGRGSEVDPITDAVLVVISPSQEMHVAQVPAFDDPDEELAYVLAQAGRRWVPESVVEE